MKKIILSLMLLVGLGSALQVSAQEPMKTSVTRTRYYYYPSSNVYYNPTTDEYWYYDEGATTWEDVKTLPTTITLGKTPRYTVYYNGTDVWKDNASHRTKYKVKANGVVKTKPKN